MRSRNDSVFTIGKVANLSQEKRPPSSRCEMLGYHRNIIAMQATCSTDTVSNKLKRYDAIGTNFDRRQFGPLCTGTPGTDAYLNHIAQKRRFRTARLMEAE